MNWYNERKEVNVLKHQTFTTVKEVQTQWGDDEIHFLRADGTGYAMYHQQDCCERVWIENINGALSDLEGVPILQADESHSTGYGGHGSETWTFYKLATIKGYVTIRWYGTSNGYYSEVAHLREI